MEPPMTMLVRAATGPPTPLFVLAGLNMLPVDQYSLTFHPGHDFAEKLLHHHHFPVHVILNPSMCCFQL